MEKEKLNEIEARIEGLQNQMDELRVLLEDLKNESASDTFSEPVDIMLDEPEEAETTPEPEMEPAPVAEPEPAEESGVESQPEPEPAEESGVESQPEPESAEEPEPVREPEPKPVPAALDYQWAKDIPGGPVSNIISGISLNDRVLLINTLFKEDPILFQQTIAAFNGMAALSEAVEYVRTNFPGWNLGSDIVYRLMMAVRRKLK